MRKCITYSKKRERVKIGAKTQSTIDAVFQQWSQNGHEMATGHFRAVFGQPENAVKMEYGGYALIRTGDPIIMSDVL